MMNLQFSHVGLRAFLVTFLLLKNALKAEQTDVRSKREALDKRCGREVLNAVSQPHVLSSEIIDQLNDDETKRTCEWRIRGVLEGSAIQLHIQLNSSPLDLDLQIVDSDNSSILYNSKETLETNTTAVSSGRDVIVRYVATAPLLGKFSLYYSSIYVCGKTEKLDSIGDVKTIAFSGRDSALPSVCWWTIYTNADLQLIMNMSFIRSDDDIFRVHFTPTSAYATNENLIGIFPKYNQVVDLLSPTNYLTTSLDTVNFEMLTSVEITYTVVETSNKNLLGSTNGGINRIEDSNEGCGTSKLSVSNGERRILTSPNFPSSYPPETNCWWTIEAPLGFYIEVDVHHFNTEACCDSLSMYNSGDINLIDPEQRFAMFNGERHLSSGKSKSKTTKIVSGTSTLSMNFRSDDKIELEGFNLTYRAVAVQPGCEHNHKYVKLGQSFRIASPNHPSNYNPSQDCWWLISSPPETRIALTFKHFSTENCCDTLTIYNAPSPAMSNVLNRIRVNKGSSYETYTFSISNYLTLHFVSDFDLQDTGFDIIVTAVEQSTIFTEDQDDVQPKEPESEAAPETPVTSDECGRTQLLATNQTSALMSPGHPKDYTPNLDCWWIITAPEGQRVLLTIETFATEECCDKLKIYNGKIVSEKQSSDGEAVNEISGLRNTTEYLSETEYIRLNFNSDFEWQNSGFRILYQAVTSTEDDLVTITEVIDEEELLCGRSDLIALEDLIGSIVTPGYPFGLHAGFECWWAIQTFSDLRILLTVLDFETGPNVLEIFDASSVGDSTNDTLILRLYGDNIEPDFKILTRGTSVTMHFKAEPSAMRNAFNITYTASGFPEDANVKEEEDEFEEELTTILSYLNTTTTQITTTTTTASPGCGGALHATSKEMLFSSPDFPDMYPPNVHCEWTMIPPPGGRIQLTIADVDIETCCDFVQPYENNDPLERPANSDKSFYYLLAPDAEGKVVFHSDPEIMGRGFRGIFRAVFTSNPPDLDLPSVCGFDKMSTDALQLLETPGYPTKYPRAIECIYMIHAPEGQVELLIDEGETEECCDKFQIYSGNEKIATVAGAITSQQRYVSSGRDLTVIFSSDKSIERSGFRAHFRTFKRTTTPTTTTQATPYGCGYTAYSSDEPQILESPNYPKPYDPSLLCQWVIRSPGNGTFIHVHIEAMETEQCCDHLELFDKSKKMVRTSGDVIEVMNYATESDTLVVRFRSDGSIQLNGFRLRFANGYEDQPNVLLATTPATKTEEVCGFVATAGVIQQPISSPNWPLSYPMNSNCTWTITAPPGMRIRVVFEKFHTERCCDYLTITDGNLRPRKFNGKVILSDRTSLTESLKLNFFSDSSITKPGFSGYFVAVDSPATKSETTIPSIHPTILETTTTTEPTTTTTEPTTTTTESTTTTTKPTTTTKEPTTTTTESTTTTTEPTTTTTEPTTTTRKPTTTEPTTTTTEPTTTTTKPTTTTTEPTTTTTKPTTTTTEPTTTTTKPTTTEATTTTTELTTATTTEPIISTAPSTTERTTIPPPTTTITTAKTTEKLLTTTQASKLTSTETTTTPQLTTTLSEIQNTIHPTTTNSASTTNGPITTTPHFPSTVTEIEGESIQQTLTTKKMEETEIIEENTIERLTESWSGESPETIAPSTSRPMMLSTMKSLLPDAEEETGSAETKDTHTTSSIPITPIGTISETTATSNVSKIECYVGTNVEVEGLVQVTDHTLTYCDDSSACFSSDLVLQLIGGDGNHLTGKVRYGRCVRSCEDYSCSSITQAILQSFSGPVEVTECKLHCCKEDSCNKPPTRMDPAGIIYNPQPTTIATTQESFGNDIPSSQSTKFYHTSTTSAENVDSATLRRTTDDAQDLFTKTISSTIDNSASEIIVDSKEETSPSHDSIKKSYSATRSTSADQSSGDLEDFSTTAIVFPSNIIIDSNEESSAADLLYGDSSSIASTTPSISTTLDQTTRPTTTTPAPTTTTQAVIEMSEIPFLPGCSFEETRTNVWLCTASFFNNLPFPNKNLCRSNIQHLESCIDGMMAVCASGTKTSFITGKLNITSIKEMKEMFFMLSPFILRPNYELYCLKDVNSTSSVVFSDPTYIIDSHETCSVETTEDLIQVQKNFHENALEVNDLSSFCREYWQYTDQVISKLKLCPRVIETLLPSADEIEEILGSSKYSSVIAENLPRSIEKLRIPKCISSQLLLEKTSQNIIQQPEAEIANADGAWSPPTCLRPRLSYSYFKSIDAMAESCHSYSLDCMFLIDGSGSLTKNQFSKLLDFAKNVTSYFDLKKNNFGVMEYSHYYKNKCTVVQCCRALTKQRYLATEIAMGDYHNHLEFNTAVDAIEHHGYTTYTAHAIRKAVEIEFPKTGRFLDPCVKKTIVVITDGKASDTRSLLTEANNGRQKGFTFLAVGVSRAKKRELEHIAVGAEKSQARTYFTKNFNNLFEFVAPLRGDLFNSISFSRADANME